MNRLDIVIQAIKNKGVFHPFLVVYHSDAAYLNKVVSDAVQWLIDYPQDFLDIRDFSETLGKKHILRLSNETETTTSKELAKEHHYEDIGAKEIQTWLSRSALGSRKVVLIHNIQRINISAANALLKSLEEPLPDRLIIATIPHPRHMLDTLVSRAFLLSLGGWQRLSSDLAATHNLTETLTQWQSISGITDRYRLLEELHKNKTLTAFLDILIHQYDEQWQYHHLAQIITLQKRLWSHVNTSSALMSFALGN